MAESEQNPVDWAKRCDDALYWSVVANEFQTFFHDAVTSARKGEISSSALKDIADRLSTHASAVAFRRDDPANERAAERKGFLLGMEFTFRAMSEESGIAATPAQSASAQKPSP